MAEGAERPKAKVEITVTYAGKEWWDEGECDPMYFYDELGDLVAGIDYEVREECKKREDLKEALRK
jgi:hypothetical protein